MPLHRLDLASRRGLMIRVIVMAMCAATAESADSFQSQFTSATFYGLAVAGISLGAAIGAALLGLLVYCLVLRNRKEDRKLTQSDTEASNSSSSQQHQQQQQQQQAQKPQQLGVASFGSMALPAGGGSDGVGSRTSSSDGGVRRGGGGGSEGSAAGRAHYANHAFDHGDGTKSGDVGGVGIYRHSSFLRPVSYASLESNKSQDRLASHHHQQQQPVITHAAVRTSPAGTLDPHQFLSQGAINVPRQPLQLHRQQLVGPDQNRLSYAEQQQQQQPSRFPSQSPALSTQPEEPAAAAPSATARKSPSRPEGPSFPRPTSQMPQQPQPMSPTAGVDAEDSQVAWRQQSLHRIQLGGGGPSVTSTVLKQEAINAFDFLEGYEDGN